jgi:hypothetical protein
MKGPRRFAMRFEVARLLRGDAMRVKVTMDQIAQARERFAALPPPLPESLSRGKAIAILAPDIALLRKAGRSMAEIAAALTSVGIEVTAARLRSYVNLGQRKAKGGGRNKNPLRGLAGRTATAAGTVRDEVGADSAPQSVATAASVAPIVGSSSAPSASHPAPVDVSSSSTPALVEGQSKVTIATVSRATCHEVDARSPPEPVATAARAATIADRRSVSSRLRAAQVDVAVPAARALGDGELAEPQADARATSPTPTAIQSTAPPASQSGRADVSLPATPTLGERKSKFTIREDSEVL